MGSRSAAGSLFAFTIFAGFTIALFVFQIIGTSGYSHLLCGVAALVVGGLLFAVIHEWRLRRPTSTPDEFSVDDIGSFAAVVVGALATFGLSIYLELGAVVASGAVGLVAAVVIKRHAAAAFCGSFVGMSSSLVLPTLGCVALAGTIAGVVFVLGKRVLNGFGGKLGTTAMIGCLAAATLLGQDLAGGAIPSGPLVWWIVGYSAIGAVITYVASIRWRLGPVAASAIVGLAAGLLLPYVHTAVDGGLIAVAVFCASFAGMSAAERMSSGRIPGEVWMTLAGVLCGVAFVYTAPYFGGAGGKLGTIAFGSTIAIRGLLDLGTIIRTRFPPHARMVTGG